MATLRKLLSSQLIGVDKLHTQFRTGNPSFHETHTFSQFSHLPKAKKALEYFPLHLVGHTFFVTPNEMILSQKINSQSPNNFHFWGDATTATANTEMATFTCKLEATNFVS